MICTLDSSDDVDNDMDNEVDENDVEQVLYYCLFSQSLLDEKKWTLSSCRTTNKNERINRLCLKLLS